MIKLILNIIPKINFSTKTKNKTLHSKSHYIAPTMFI